MHIGLNIISLCLFGCKYYVWGISSPNQTSSETELPWQPGEIGYHLVSRVTMATRTILISKYCNVLSFWLHVL